MFNTNRYARRHGFRISRRPSDLGRLQFANGTCQETSGVVNTHWKFDSGASVPVTFHLLENCCHDVVLGDDFIWDHDLFNAHATSMCALDDQLHRLAPFAFEGRISKLLNRYRNVKGAL